METLNATATQTTATSARCTYSARGTQCSNPATAGDRCAAHQRRAVEPRNAPSSDPAAAGAEVTK